MTDNCKTHQKSNTRATTTSSFKAGPPAICFCRQMTRRIQKSEHITISETAAIFFLNEMVTKYFNPLLEISAICNCVSSTNNAQLCDSLQKNSSIDNSNLTLNCISYRGSHLSCMLKTHFSTRGGRIIYPLPPRSYSGLI